MAPMVYVTASVTLQATIDIAKWYKAGFMITQLKTSNYTKNEMIGQLEVLIVIVQ